MIKKKTSANKSEVNFHGFPYSDIPTLNEHFERTINVVGMIDEEMSYNFVCEMHKLLAEDMETPITIMISTPGGDADETRAMYDVMRFAKQYCTVRTVAFSKCCSGGAYLLAAGTAGHRTMYPSSTLMIHGMQLSMPYGDFHNNCTELFQSAARESELLTLMLAEEIGKTIDKDGNEVYPDAESLESSVALASELTSKDYYLSPDDAKEYGFIDNVGICSHNIKVPLDEEGNPVGSYTDGEEITDEKLQEFLEERKTKWQYVKKEKTNEQKRSS